MNKLFSHTLLCLVICFHQVASQCDKEETIRLGMETVRIKFPPDNTQYGRNQTCKWRFLADSPIIYQITNIGVDCGDNLMVFTGDSPNPGESICCKGCNKSASETTGSELKITLISDGTTHDSETGFTVDLIAAKRLKFCPKQPIHVTFEKQQIVSPGIPLYLANLNCTINLIAPHGMTFTLQYVDVEKHEDCSIADSCCDVLKIYDGKPQLGKKPVLATCGIENFHPNFIYESSGGMSLQLITDDQVPKRGFVATVQAKEENVDFAAQSDLTLASHEVGGSNDVGFSTAKEGNADSVTQSELNPVRPMVTSSPNTGFSAGPCSAECKGQVSCYLEHNCTNYQRCYALNPAECHCKMMTCSYGTFWNPKINTCDRIPNVPCKYDPCLKLQPGATYKSNLNCRTFYVCSHSKRSLPKCCKEGYAYHESEGCKQSTSCKVQCAEQGTKNEEPLTPTPTCYLRAVRGRVDKYYNVISNVEQDCPPGTVFKPDSCVCTKDATHTHPRCTPMVNVNFAGERIINLSHESYIQVENVARRKSEKSNTWFGIFNGKSSSIQVPRLSAVALPRLRIKMSFYPEYSTGSRYQVLVSNCRSSAKPWNIPEVALGQTPSLAIMVDTVDKELTFLGYSDGELAKSAVFTLPFKDNTWNEVYLTYNGASLDGRIRSLGQNSTEVKGQKPLSGRLAPSQGPVSVGRCSDGDAYRGRIGLIEVYDCMMR